MAHASKTDLIAEVSERTGVKKSDVKKVVDELFDPNNGTILGYLIGGNDVRISGFGNWTAKLMPARNGRNPATGESIRIEAKYKVAFRVGKTLKDTVIANLSAPKRGKR